MPALNEAEQKALIERYERSGKTARGFIASEECPVSTRTFYKYYKKWRSDAGSEAASLVPDDDLADTPLPFEPDPVPDVETSGPRTYRDGDADPLFDRLEEARQTVAPSGVPPSATEGWQVSALGAPEPPEAVTPKREPDEHVGSVPSWATWAGLGAALLVGLGIGAGNAKEKEAVHVANRIDDVGRTEREPTGFPLFNERA